MVLNLSIFNWKYEKTMFNFKLRADLLRLLLHQKRVHRYFVKPENISYANNHLTPHLHRTMQ